MKLFLTFAALLSVALGSPTFRKFDIPIKSHLHEIDAPSGTYSVTSEGADGTKVLEAGSLTSGMKNVGAVRKGSYSYISPEGELVKMSYVADERGFRPVGTHIPVAVEEIRSLPKVVMVEDFVVSEPPTTMVREHHHHHDHGHHGHHGHSRIIPSSVQAPAPTKTFVQTQEFIMDSTPSRSFVQIGN